MAKKSILKPAENEQAYLKCGFLGWQGSGKTYTATELVVGLHQHCGSDRPVAFADSETGSDWARGRFMAAGIELLVAKTRAFADLLSVVDEAQDRCFALIVDSATHYWDEVVAAYKRQHRCGDRMAWHHWGPIKAQWAQFTDRFVCAPLHMVVCGRARWDYDMEEDDRGVDQLVKTGTSMKSEKNFGYEPSLLVEMERFRADAEIGAPVRHVAHVLKDRNMSATSLDGARFEDPTFSDFLPHIEQLNLGGRHNAFDEKSTSDHLFEGDEDRAKDRRAKAALLDEVKESLVYLYPSTKAADKRAKAALVDALFGTVSWEKAKRADIRRLRIATEVLRELMGISDEGLLPIDAAELKAMAEKYRAKAEAIPEEVQSEADAVFCGGESDSDDPEEPLEME